MTNVHSDEKDKCNPLHCVFSTSNREVSAACVPSAL